MTPARVIGRDNDLPWHLPADLRHFRELTMGKRIIMGRRTAESLAQALPGRENIVISRNPDFSLPGMTVVDSLSQACQDYDGPEIMIIGGGALYALSLPYVHRMYLTLVEADIAGDTYFPPFEKRDWRLISNTPMPVDDKNAIPFSFQTLDRVSAASEP